MLGSTRHSVSTAAAILKEEKLIDHTRGAMRILEAAGLEHSVRVLPRHQSPFDSYTQFDSGVVA